MEPITLIVTALATGAAAGLTDTMTAAVHDAYLSLKKLVRRRLGSRADGELVLARHAEAPRTWEGPLAAELSAAGADADSDLVQAAQALMRLADEVGYRAGKYNVDARGSRGVQVGDHNTSTTSSAPPVGQATLARMMTPRLRTRTSCRRRTLGMASGTGIDARGAEGVQIGNQGTQINYFYNGTWISGVTAVPAGQRVRDDRISVPGPGRVRGAGCGAVLRPRGRRHRSARGDVAAPGRGGLVVVSGVSGAGKSSLMRAGVLPGCAGPGSARPRRRPRGRAWCSPRAVSRLEELAVELRRWPAWTPRRCAAAGRRPGRFRPDRPAGSSGRPGSGAAAGYRAAAGTASG